VLEATAEAHPAQQRRYLHRKPAMGPKTVPFTGNTGMRYLPHTEVLKALREPEPDEEGFYETPN
jgi:hypothetical protein